LCKAASRDECGGEKGRGKQRTGGKIAGPGKNGWGERGGTRDVKCFKGTLW